MGPWYAQSTNYARDDYARYLSRLLEGEEAYDAVFSSPLVPSALSIALLRSSVLLSDAVLEKEPDPESLSKEFSISDNSI